MPFKKKKIILSDQQSLLIINHFNLGKSRVQGESPADSWLEKHEIIPSIIDEACGFHIKSSIARNTIASSCMVHGNAVDSQSVRKINI